MELIDDRGLADTGISGNQHQLRPAALYDAIKASKQCLDFPLAAVEFLQNQKPVWCVVLAKRKLVDAAMTLPFRKTAPEIALNASCRLSRDMAVNPLHRIGRSEGKAPGEHFIKRHPKRVEIAPRIDRTIHPSG